MIAFCQHFDNFFLVIQSLSKIFLIQRSRKSLGYLLRLNIYLIYFHLSSRPLTEKSDYSSLEIPLLASYL